MPPHQRIAVTLPAGPNLADNIERVRWAEEHGYEDAWFGDAGAPDALTMTTGLGDIRATISGTDRLTTRYMRGSRVEPRTIRS